jgi:hypothetical protein
MSRPRPLAFAAVVLAVAVLAAACGVNDTGSAEGITPGLGLDDTAPTTTSTTTTTTVPTQSTVVASTSPTSTTPVQTESVQLWFISGTSLNPITRSLTYPATLDQVMVALQAGPSELGPPASSLRTAVPGAPALSARDNLDGTATVDLPVAFFGNIQGQDQLRAIGQIVLTLTMRPGIGGVKFTSAGEDAAVILGNGQQSARGQVVTRADYRALTGDVPPTTPTSPPPSTTVAVTAVAGAPVSETTVG